MKYKYHQDLKITIWQQQSFEIEADSQEEADNIASNFKDKDASNEIEVSCEMLYDTQMLTRPIEDNCGFATIEVYRDGEEKPLCDNGIKH